MGVGRVGPQNGTRGYPRTRRPVGFYHVQREVDRGRSACKLLSYSYMNNPLVDFRKGNLPRTCIMLNIFRFNKAP